MNMKNKTHTVGWIPERQEPLFVDDMVETLKSDIKAIAPRYKEDV